MTTQASKCAVKSRMRSEKSRLDYNSYMRKWHNAHPEKRMFWDARNRARKENLPFNISVEDIKIPSECPVLGIPIFVVSGDRGDNSPSIDRITPCKGYTKENIRVISWRANKLKSDATPNELRLLAEDSMKVVR